jgi:hypothetical protein
MSQTKIKKNKEKIVKILNENIDLEYNLRLKRFERFSEKVATVSKKDLTPINLKIGHWFEWFYDEDFPSDKKHAVKIERNEIYEIDGQKSNHWNKIKYYSIENV